MSSFSRTFHVGRWTQVPLHANEVEGSGGSFGSFSSTVSERKQETNSSSVACKGSLVNNVWHEELSKRVEIPWAVVNPPWRHWGGLVSYWVLDCGCFQHEYYSSSAEELVSDVSVWDASNYSPLDWRSMNSILIGYLAVSQVHRESLCTSVLLC